MMVAVRADATALTGVGHVMRCLALAEEFARSGDQVHWVGDLASQPWLLDKVSRIAISIAEPEGLESEQAKQVLEINPDVTIVDSYELGEAFCSPVKNSSTALIAIIDSTSHLNPADMYVAPGAEAISPVMVRDTPILQGVRYVLIRKELRPIKKKMESSREQARQESGVRRVAVLMGGTDVAELAPSIVEGLLTLDVPISIDAVPRPTGTLTKADLPGPSKSSTVTWWDAGEGIYPRVAEADLVISAAGVSSWELLYLGLPIGLIEVADNQASNYLWMTSRGHAWGLGGSTGLKDPGTLMQGLRALLESDFESMRARKTIVDGCGAQRVVRAARQLVQRINS